MRQGDDQTSQACLEQHLQLVQQLGDWQGEINAWSKMAQLATGEGGGRGEGTGTGGGGEGGIHNVDGVRGGIDPEGDATISRGGAGVAGAIGKESVARALWCFERAAVLAKTHNKVNAGWTRTLRVTTLL